VRVEIILRAAEGKKNSEISEVVGVTRQTVRTWRGRFTKHRLDDLDDEPRCGTPRKIGDDKIEAIIVKTLEEKPKGATHWSTRSMAEASGRLDLLRASHMARILTTAASNRDVQALGRPAIR
jgi:transposase